MNNIGKVFISHSSKDKKFVDRLVSDLIKVGIQVWYDKFDVSIGDSITERINNGLEESKYFLVVISPSALASVWVQEELNAALVRQVQLGGTFLIPVIIADCDIPPLIAHRRYADFRKSYSHGIKSLLGVWGFDLKVIEKFPDSNLYPWPREPKSTSSFIYLYSVKFDKLFKLDCSLSWTVDYLSRYIMAELELPLIQNISKIGATIHFSYRIVFRKKKLPIDKKLSEVGIENGSVIGLNIFSEYIDWNNKGSVANSKYETRILYQSGINTKKEESTRPDAKHLKKPTQQQFELLVHSCFKHI